MTYLYDFLARQEAIEFAAYGITHDRRLLRAHPSWNPVYVPMELPCTGGSQRLPMATVHLTHKIVTGAGLFRIGFLNEPVRLLVYSIESETPDTHAVKELE